MPHFEGPSRHFSDYNWGFIVPSTTVGPGDIDPSSAGGRFTSVVIMIFGIGVIAAAAAHGAESMIDLGRSRIMGKDQLRERDHLAVLGYCQGETEQLVDETAADHSIVLCTGTLPHNPMLDNVSFVSGNLTCEEILARACVSEAARILVHCCDDNETLVVALAARSVTPNAHMVTVDARAENDTHLKRVCENIEIVTSLAVSMMLQSIQAPGATAVVFALLSNATDDTIFSLKAPNSGESRSFGTLQGSLKGRLGATLIAMSSSESQNGVKLNPLANDPVLPGASLLYIAPKRIASAP